MSGSSTREALASAKAKEHFSRTQGVGELATSSAQEIHERKAIPASRSNSHVSSGPTHVSCSHGPEMVWLFQCTVSEGTSNERRCQATAISLFAGGANFAASARFFNTERDLPILPSAWMRARRGEFCPAHDLVCLHTMHAPPLWSHSALQASQHGSELDPTARARRRAKRICCGGTHSWCKRMSVTPGKFPST